MNDLKNETAEVVNEILDGMHDDGLRAILSACKERGKIADRIEAARFKSTVKVGTRVRLDGISPKYLNGSTAVVTSVNTRGQRVEVKLDENVGRFRAGSPIGCPVACLTVIEEGK